MTFRFFGTKIGKTATTNRFFHNRVPFSAGITFALPFGINTAAILTDVLFLIFFATSLLTRSFSLIYTALYVVIILIAGNWVLRMPKKSAESTYANNQEQFHCEPQTHTFFYENEMRGKNNQSGVEIRIPYDQIVMVMETKNLFLIRIPEKRMVLVDKRGFQRGSSSEFGAFLREKCTAAKFC